MPRGGRKGGRGGRGVQAKVRLHVHLINAVDLDRVRIALRHSVADPRIWHAARGRRPCRPTSAFALVMQFHRLFRAGQWERGQSAIFSFVQCTARKGAAGEAPACAWWVLPAVPALTQHLLNTSCHSCACLQIKEYLQGRLQQAQDSAAACSSEQHLLPGASRGAAALRLLAPEARVPLAALPQAIRAAKERGSLQSSQVGVLFRAVSGCPAGSDGRPGGLASRGSAEGPPPLQFTTPN